MKKRNGFVSNSSSSSFVIDPTDLNDYQLASIKKIAKLIKQNNSDDFVDENDGCYRLSVEYGGESDVARILDAFNIKYEED